LRTVIMQDRPPIPNGKNITPRTAPNAGELSAGSAAHAVPLGTVEMLYGPVVTDDKDVRCGTPPNTAQVILRSAGQGEPTGTVVAQNRSGCANGKDIAGGAAPNAEHRIPCGQRILTGPSPLNGKRGSSRSIDGRSCGIGRINRGSGRGGGQGGGAGRGSRNGTQGT
jgi:hypothetical protein